MLKQIIWSPLSENDLNGILNYLAANWDMKVTRNFISLIKNTLLQLETNPKQFPIINRKEKIRKCVLTKHNTLFYKEKHTQIEILRIYDSRQNPQNLIFK